MVSFGFLGTPTTVSFKEYQILSGFGFNPVGDISNNFHNEHYVFLPSVYKRNTRNSEKKITNICRFLDADAIVESGVNSVLNIKLKADIVILHGKLATYFQAKSSPEGLQSYETKYFGKQLKPFSSTCPQYKGRTNLQESYGAPGGVYLNTQYGDSSLPKFLREFSEWAGLSIKEDYNKLLQVLLKAKQPISSKVLQKVFHDSYVMERVTQWGSIYPINVSEGYVQLKRQKSGREAGRTETSESYTYSR